MPRFRGENGAEFTIDLEGLAPHLREMHEQQLADGRLIAAEPAKPARKAASKPATATE